MKYKAWNRKLEVITAALTAALAALLIFQATPGQNYKSQLSLGNRFLTAGNYEKAEAAFNEAIKIDSKKADPYLGLGSVYAIQADAIFNQYQNGTSSGEDGSAGMIPAEEKERMEELYHKAQEAWKQASELDSGNEDAEQALSYVEQQQEKAGEWKTDDSASEAEITPTPEPDLEDLVNLEGGSTTEIEENQQDAYYDLDGDGTTEGIRVETRKDGEGVEWSSQVFIQNQVVLDFSKDSSTGGGIAGTVVVILQLNTGDTFIGTYVEYMDDGDTGEAAIYHYQNGKLIKLFDLDPIDDTGQSFHDDTYDITAQGNTISFTVHMQPAATGLIEMTRTLICHDGTLEFLGNEAEIKSYPYYDYMAENPGGETDPEYYPARIAIPCYETGDSQTVTLTIEPETMCKVTKAYFTDGMHIKRFRLETEDGRTGWFDQSLTTTGGEYGTKVPILYGHGFAG